MALPVPNLDDRNYEQLVAEERALIPRNFPEWTDHNPSDPGITLLELFAFLMETAIFQINRVPDRSLANFAALVGRARKPGESIQQAVGEARESLEPGARAIMAPEMENLARQAAPEKIGRVKAILLENRDNPTVFPFEQIIQLVVVPFGEEDAGVDLRQTVFEFVRQRCLITTRLQVVSPSYTYVQVDVTVVRDPASPWQKSRIQEELEQRIRNLLSPTTGGDLGSGWEFGRSVFRSELCEVIEGTPGVEHMHRLLLNGKEDVEELPLSPGNPKLQPISLVRLAEGSPTVVVVDPVGG